MLHDDRIIFGLLLSKIYLRNKLDLDPEFNYLIRGQDLDPRDAVQSAIDNLKEKFTYFKDLMPGVVRDSNFASWMTSATPEDQVPKLWSDDDKFEEAKGMKELILVKSFRPDRLVQACQKWVNVVLGNGFNADKELDLASIVEAEVNANTPILMCSVAGFDASGRVDDLAAELSKPMTSIAIGKSQLCHSKVMVEITACDYK